MEYVSPEYQQRLDNLAETLTQKIPQQPDQYDFTQWPVERLDTRYTKLVELLPLVLSQQRRAIMGREMSHIIFEIQSRELESGIAI